MKFPKAALSVVVTMVILLASMAPTVAMQTSSPEATPPGDSTPRFVLRPVDGQDGGFFTVNAAPGSTTELVAVLGNAGTEEIDLRTYVSNAVTLVNGGFGVEDEDAEQTGATTWIDWPAETFTFGPTEGTERTFTVTVPEDAAPGEYIAGISLQTAEPVEIPGSTMFNQIIRKSIAVFIIVEGETTAGFDLGEPEITATEQGGVLNVPIENTGDVLVKPTGTVTLTNADGEEVFRTEIAMGSVYAHTETSLSILLDPSFVGGNYNVAVSLGDASTGTTAEAEGADIAYSGEPLEEAPVQLNGVAITPMPDAAAPLYADVELTLSVADSAIPNANIVLHVSRDGEPVEDFALANNTTISAGESTISQRYIPADGFEQGEWSFTVSIETSDPQTGSVTVIVSEPIEDTISIP